LKKSEKSDILYIENERRKQKINLLTLIQNKKLKKLKHLERKQPK